MSAQQSIRVRRGKLLKPQLGSGVVPRPRLHARLDEGIGKPLTLVSGPAGSGKTTLLCEWLASVSVPVAWLSLDEGDTDLASFVDHVVAALQVVVHGFGRSTLGLLRMAGAPSPVDVAIELGDELLELSSDIVLVLDDYHAVDSSHVDEFLSTLLQYPPPRLRIVLVSRVDPFLPLVRLRAHGQLAEVRSSDLRFTDDETRSLLWDATDREPDQDTVGLLQERTEGWAAGLRLAVIALQQRPGPVALAGAESSMAAFLADEMVTGQPEDVQRFLLRTAVPERLCAGLCDVLLESVPVEVASKAMLERIERAGLFLIPLGEDRHWYRYHHLFRSLLLRRLAELEGEDEVRYLHARASAWLADHALVDEAIPHALASRVPDLAAELVERHVQHALAERRWVSIERWLGLLPPEQVQGRPALLLAQAWVQRLRGQDVAFALTVDRLDALLAGPAGKSDPVATERWRAEATFLRRTFLAAYDLEAQATLDAATRAAETIPWETHATASTALVYLGAALQMIGDEAAAIRVLTRALAECAGRSDPFALHRVQCASLGLIGVRFNAGNLDRCRATASELLDLTTVHNLGWGAVMARAYLGTVAYEQNQLDAAIGHFAAAAEEAEASSLILSRVFFGLALAHEMAGHRFEADATVNHYLDRLIATDATSAIPAVRSFQARLAVTRGEIGAAMHWLGMSRVAGPGGSAHAFEVPLLTRASVLLAEGSDASHVEASAALDDLLVYAVAVHAMPLRIASLATQALVRHAQGRLDAALATLGEALSLAEPHGFCRTFLDLGERMATLLALYAAQVGVSPLVARLFEAHEERPAAGAVVAAPPVAVRVSSPAAAPLVEPLTEREMEVLDGLVRRLSNKEIAEVLAISPHTIKRHTASIYGKLGVSSRRQAVHRAMEAGLVAERWKSEPPYPN